MFTTSTSVRFNTGDLPELTPEQVWAGLVIRARNGDERFAPPGHRFEVIDDSDAAVVRRAYLADGREELQRITMHGERVMVFEFIEGPQKSVILCAIETDDEGEYRLRLTFLTTFPELVHHSVEEQEFAARRRPLMQGQPNHILGVVRQLVNEGVLQ
ncbi:AtaL-like protein [uncultured Amnibacterium sp.]|uniref:AtaL-like protein n=1 Tax=uncultured Amnibacterium sp. TaxID=1631851 RepID=UPI0035CA4C45